jgi:hypothetical protein
MSHYTNVTLTFDFDFGLVHPVHGRYGWGRPTWRRKKATVKQRKLKSGPHKGPDTKMNWPTDRRSQYNLNSDVQVSPMPWGITGSPCLGDINMGTRPSRLGSLRWDSKIWLWVLYVIALQITDTSSHRGRPTWRKKVIVTERNLKSGHLSQRGPYSKTNWLTDRRSQYNWNINLKWVMQWLRLALSKRPNRVGLSLPSPEDGSRSSFGHIVLWTKSRNSDSDHSVPVIWNWSITSYCRCYILIQCYHAFENLVQILCVPSVCICTVHLCFVLLWHIHPTVIFTNIGCVDCNIRVCIHVSKLTFNKKKVDMLWKLPMKVCFSRNVLSFCCHIMFCNNFVSNWLHGCKILFRK